MQKLTSTWTAAREELAIRRARRAEDSRLVRELSAYTSNADQNELDAIIARAPEEEAARIDRIVGRLRAAA